MKVRGGRAGLTIRGGRVGLTIRGGRAGLTIRGGRAGLTIRGGTIRGGRTGLTIRGGRAGLMTVFQLGRLHMAGWDWKCIWARHCTPNFGIRSWLDLIFLKWTFPALSST